MLGLITSEKLNAIKTVYYHGSCADGIVAREIMKRVLPAATCTPFYFEELKEIPKNALFIDCSPKPHQIEACLEEGCCIADHHDTFRESFDRLCGPTHGAMLFGENSLGESGAVLASVLHAQELEYDHLIYNIANYIGVSDTWQKNDASFEDSRILSKYITMFGNDFSEDICTLLADKSKIDAMRGMVHRQNEKLVKSAIILGHPVKAAYINSMQISDAAEILREKHEVKVVIGWEMIQGRNNHPIIACSIRATPDFDCSKFAQAQGGGGHKAAAGFEIPAHPETEAPIGTIHTLLSGFLASN